MRPIVIDGVTCFVGESPGAFHVQTMQGWNAMYLKGSMQTMHVNLHSLDPRALMLREAVNKFIDDKHAQNARD